MNGVRGHADSGWDADIRRIASGTTLMLIGFVVYMALGFGFQLVVARWLPPADVGRYFQAAAVVSVLIAVCTGGVAAAIVRFVAILEPPEALTLSRRIVVADILASVGIAAVLVAVAPSVAIGFFRDPSMSVLLRICALALPFGTLGLLAAANARAWARFGFHFTAEQVALPGGRLIVAIVLLAVGAGVAGAAFAFVAGFAASAAIGTIGMLRIAARLPRRLPRLRAGLTGEVLRFSAYRWGTDLLQSVLLWADIIILAFFWPPAVTGVYAVASRVILFVATGLPALNLAIARFFAQRVEGASRHELGELFSLASRWGVILTMVPLAYVVVLRTQVLELFGDAFLEGGAALSILAVGFATAAVFGPSGVLLNMSNRNRLVLWDNVATVALNVGLNLLLIPSMGMVGAATAWSASKVLVNVLQLYQVWRYLDVKVFRREHAITAFSIGSVAIIGTTASVMGTGLGVVVLSLGVPVVLFLTRSPEEGTWFKALLRTTSSHPRDAHAGSASGSSESGDGGNA